MRTRSKCGPSTSFSAEEDDLLHPIATRQPRLMCASSSTSHNRLMLGSMAIVQNPLSVSKHTPSIL